MYRFAMSYQDAHHRITPRHRGTAESIGEAIEAARRALPGVELDSLTEQEVSASHQRVNDFRCDAAAPEGGVWRVVIAPMI